MNVYLVTMIGVYDHGTAGVFETRAEAEARALALDARSDRYHTWRVDKPVVGEPVHPDSDLGIPNCNRSAWANPDDRCRVEFVPHTAREDT